MKKTMFILRGTSGSGKSTWSDKKLQEAMKTGAQCRHASADDFFLDEDCNYNFDPTRLSEAHNYCLRSVLDAIQMGWETVIVDNTNTEAHEIAPYRALALAYGYKVKILHFQCEVETSIARNVHNVPEKTIRSQHYRLSKPLPRYWEKQEIIRTS